MINSRRMANPEHLKRLKEGVAGWNKWREESSRVVPDLSGATLSAAQMSGANLSNANLDVYKRQGM